jgi:hypothetical protein
VSLCETAQGRREGDAHDGPGSFCPLELRHALKAADTDGVVRHALESVSQALIDAEAIAVIGPGRMSTRRPG